MGNRKRARQQPCDDVERATGGDRRRETHASTGDTTAIRLLSEMGGFTLISTRHLPYPLAGEGQEISGFCGDYEHS